MTEPRRKQGLDERQAGSTSGKRPFKVIPVTGEVDPTKRKPPRIRVVGQDERLTPEERKRRFARNLDLLIGLVGLSRKEVADEIGVKHKLILRLVSAGVGFSDNRNADSMKRIAAYFALPSVDDLWRADLLQLVLPNDYISAFVEKFRPRLLAERQKRLAEERQPSLDELGILSRALGFEAETSRLTGPLAEKVAAILGSEKAEQFKRLINDYYELALAARTGKKAQ